MIKKFSLFVALILFSFSCYAQENIVKWNSNIVYVEGDTYQLQFEASIEKGWHMYDMGPYSWNGPNPTIINVEEANGGVAQDSTFQVDKQIKIYEELYESEIGFYENSARFAQNVKLSSDKASFKVYVEYMACNDTSCTPLMDSTFVFNINASEKASYKGDVFVPYSDAQKIEKTESEKPNKSIWALIIEAVLWGFAALLTPCVFPMIPMTVSFFMKGSGSSRAGRIKAFTFGLLIVLLYTLPIAIIIMATKILGGDAVTADIFNWLATHWIPNLIFFIVFMIFAASFFGAFEITLPSSMVNKSDQNSEKKGLAGLFFMALTLVLVSFSCTGPIVGSVLIKSTAGEFWEPIITMTAFSVAFALPFTIFAMFPSLLKNLPKSGGWLNSVKVVLGFIEVALGFKFLSIADQTYHWGLLDREVYLAIWIVVFSLLGLYLLGKLRFANDSEVKHITVGRLALAITSFTFVVYMIPGMFGAPLKALSGYMPPIHSQDFVLGANTTSGVSEKVNTGKYSDFLHLPHGLSGYFDLEEGMEVAKRENKPVFVDITGHGCVNCREMEARVWSDERVLEILRRDYIIVALYTDDKKEVAEEDWIKDEKGDVLKTLGRINSYIVRTKFAVNAQPNYALLDNDGNYLAPIRGYDLSVDGFIKFLEDGVKKYKSL